MPKSLSHDASSYVRGESYPSACLSCRQLAEAYCTLDAEAVAADWASKERNLPPTYVTIIGWVLGLLPVRSRTTLRSSLLPAQRRLESAGSCWRL